MAMATIATQTVPTAETIAAALAQVVGADRVERAVALTDASGLTGIAPVLIHPRDAAEVAEAVAWAYAHGVAIVPVGGRTGYSGGVVPEGDAPQAAIALDRLSRVRSFDPPLWRLGGGARGAAATVPRPPRGDRVPFPPPPRAP